MFTPLGLGFYWMFIRYLGRYLQSYFTLSVYALEAMEPLATLFTINRTNVGL